MLPLTISGSDVQNSSDSESETPMKTPVLDPFISDGLIPASTMASCVNSRSIRS